MAISLKEVYESLSAKGGFDSSHGKYGSLDDLKNLVNNMNTRRSASNAICNGHVNTSIGDTKLSLSRVRDSGLSLKNISCSAHITNTTDHAITCECNSRTLECHSQVSYTPSAICASRTSPVVSCICNGRTAYQAEYYYYYAECSSRTSQTYTYSDTSCTSRTSSYTSACACNSRTGYQEAYYYSYCDCNSRTGTQYSYTSSGTEGPFYETIYDYCGGRTGGTYGGSWEGCASRTAGTYSDVCSARYGGERTYYTYCSSRTSYSYYNNSTYTSGYVNAYYYSDTYCSSRTSSYVAPCECNSRTGTGSYNVCACNSVEAYVPGSNYTDYSCTTRTSYTSTCDCVTRTTTNPCVCNSRSNALCVSRTSCSCNSVCSCNTVDVFG